jgi:hypothetical protein
VLKIVIILVSLLIAALAVVVAYGASRWKEGTRELRARLEAAREPPTTGVVDFRELEGLPAPVRRFFRRVLKEGQPIVTGVRLRHQGAFNMGETTDQWKPFTSDQRVTTRRPGFDWDGQIRMMPGLTVRVHDAYVAGEGILYAEVLGLVPVVNLRDTTDIAEGELMRFVAEAPWYPTALLPSQGIRWEDVDACSARATLVDGSVTLAMTFTFNHEDVIGTVRADARGRVVGKRVVPTPWQGRFWSYEEREGMLVPLDGEVAWLLPVGVKPYWRGRISELAYAFAK